MRYFIRSVKYFIYFTLLTSLIIAALVVTGLAEGDIEYMFRGGYNALWKIALFYVAIAAVYPKVGFITRTVPYQGELNTVRSEIVSFMKDRHYELEHEDSKTLLFRHKGAAQRLTRMYEDRITFMETEGGFTMEGLRKDVFRYSTSLEYKLNPQQD